MVLFFCVWILMTVRREKKFIDHNIMILVIFMPSRSFLLIGIFRRRIESHNTIFEVEVECHFQGSEKTIFWWIVMHVNIFPVVLGLSIWWDWWMVVQKTKKVFYVIADIFVERYSMVFVWSYLSSSSFISIFALISNLVASILHTYLHSFSYTYLLKSFF